LCSFISDCRKRVLADVGGPESKIAVGHTAICVLEHMNDYHRTSFKEIGSYLETLGL
jgi:hypothetical protein